MIVFVRLRIHMVSCHARMTTLIDLNYQHKYWYPTRMPDLASDIVFAVRTFCNVLHYTTITITTSNSELHVDGIRPTHNSHRSRVPSLMNNWMSSHTEKYRVSDTETVMMCVCKGLTNAHTKGYGLLMHQKTSSYSHGPLARYVKLRVAHVPGMPWTFSPQQRVKDPDMHHGTCVTHVPWCMTGSLTSGFIWSRWRENVPGILGTCATRNYTYLVRGPWRYHFPHIIKKYIENTTGITDRKLI